jgi:hypothetical protein
MGHDSSGGSYRFNVYDSGDRDRLVDVGPVAGPAAAPASSADRAPAYDPDNDDSGSMYTLAYMIIGIAGMIVGYFAGWLTWGG